MPSDAPVTKATFPAHCSIPQVDEESNALSFYSSSPSHTVDRKDLSPPAMCLALARHGSKKSMLPWKRV
ncbi:hypothetical protein EB796_015088 [Bugula neritina]|uniref:Uncharacterized protein n=1 Tax=Bugula neritina TaxID=10212 RepID=A0A7J7JJT8_BUGNE|nr:hypothetical protein EB796_015088 [Bugula neritina]